MTQEDLIIGLIYIMAEERNPELINMLQKSSVLVTSESSSDSILDASLNALKDSPSFRQNLNNYFIKEFNSDDRTYSNSNGKTFVKYDKVTGTGGSKVGGLLRNIFTPENVQTLIAGGIGFATTKLADSASKKGNQQAIDYENAKAAAAAAATALKESSGSAGSDGGGSGGKKSPKWVLPVAIGGGLLIIGVVVYFAMKKK
jgi:hypothetical protein